MRYIRYAIDGATRRNGKIDCVAAGAVIGQIVGDGLVIKQFAIPVCEYGSTNQRGEMLALLEAITHFCSTDFPECQIITDSEYLFNTLRHDWLTKWSGTWMTTRNEPVKNQDIWIMIHRMLKMTNQTVNIYYTKGHLVPFGKATAAKLISVNPPCVDLYQAVLEKYDAYNIDPEKRSNAQELSLKNNGFYLDDETFKTFVTLNTTADAYAGFLVDRADAV